MDHALFRADPAELGVVDQVSPGLAPVGDETGEGAAKDAVGDVVDGGADDVVAAADGEGLFFWGERGGVSFLDAFWFGLVWVSCWEGETGRKKTNHAMPGVLGVRLENAVSGRVVAGGVHGVGAGLVEGGGEADIAGGPARYCDFLFGHCDCL